MKKLLQALFYKDEEPVVGKSVVFITFSGTGNIQDCRDVIHIDLGQTWVTLTYDDYSTLSFPSSAIACVGSELQED